ncbi:MAG TPA: DUF2945 domain-containing protein [Rickettsia endosymbiont of Pyrocoelia pectoralis]|nr:DUF2945 domain-containing protein [Rickettsia endosymbiont of Pyrocoelia pectoralis]
MSDFHKEGAIVFWQWYGKKLRGTVQKVYCRPIIKNIKEKEIKRNARKQNPAYYIKSDNGNHVLKLHSELIS